MSGAAAPALAPAGARATAARLWFPATVAATLAAFAALVGWNLAHTSWLDGYDAYHVVLYAETVAKEHRLPDPDETDVWHNPPLYFALAGEAELLARRLGADEDPYKAGQAVSALAAVAIVLLAFLVARELFPSSRLAQLAALGFAAATPVLVRGSVMYHPEPLTAALVGGALYAAVRALARGGLTVRSGLVVGALAGLASLTRTWGLAVVAALALVAILDAARRRTAGPAVALVLSAAVLAAPWLAYKAHRYGSPLAFSRPVPSQWDEPGRPLAFYTELAPSAVFSEPYTLHFRNRLLPVTYADWWGDWHRSFRVPAAERSYAVPLSDERRRARVLQSVVGVLPSLLTLAGVVGLAVVATRTRALPLVALLSTLALLVASYAFFLVRYPKLDGDNIKALYLLSAVVPVAVCAGWALAQVRRAGALVLAAVLLLLAGLAYVDVSFLVLPA
ncbi:MAG TPA: glycosyltransferase family 39 protein [Gaiellaceae bacterium]|nr:glycosyltransferase family 39 protein [Gaiellaceae bacterium]